MGSRNLPESKAQKNFIRKILSFGFNNYVSLIFWMNHSDYLCGFKGFHTSVAGDIFSKIKSERWVFDVELFYRLKKAGIQVYELPIAWVHKGDSKMTLFDIIKIFFSILSLRRKVGFF